MSVLGLDVGSRHIKLVESTGGKKAQIVRAFLIDTPEGAVVDGEIRGMEALVFALRDTLRKNQIRPKEVYVSLQSSQMSSRDIRLPALKKEEILPAIEFELSQSFPGIMQSHTLSFAQYSKPGEPVKGVGAFCPTRILDGYVEMAKLLDLPLVRIDASFNAIGRTFFKYNLIQNPKEALMLLDIGLTSSQVSVLSGEKVLLSRSVATGAQQVDELMISRFGITAAQAEKTRRDGTYTDFDVKEEDIHTFIRLGYSAVEDLLRQTLDFHRYNKTEEPPVGRILVTGGGSIFKGLMSYLSEVFSLPVEPAIVSMRNFPANLRQELFYGAIGAAIESGTALEDINLIPNVRAMATARSKGGKRVLAYAFGVLALLAVVGAYAGIWWLDRQEDNRSAYLRQQTEAYSSINQVKQDIEIAQRVQIGMETVLALAESDTLVQTGMLDTVTQNMPLGLFVQNYMTTGSTQLSIAGVAMTRDDIAVLINRVKAVQGVGEVRVESITTRLGEDGLPIDYNFTLTAAMKQ